MKWHVKHLMLAPEEQLIQQDVFGRHALAEPLKQILIQRNIRTEGALDAYFSADLSHLHDPFLLQDMDIAVERLSRALSNKERVMVYGDYDVDGTTSVAMMSLFLKQQEFEVVSYIPDRYTEGYGLSFKGIQVAEKEQVTLMVVLDCGIRGHDKVRFANQRGIDVIICDHHIPGEELPPAQAILNPKRPGCTYPFKELTGCGIGYKLICACKKTWEVEQQQEHLLEYLDLVALSTACDLVPLISENRTLVSLGLQKLREAPAPGISQLMKLAEGKRSWTVSDLVFFLGPHINAAGRIGSAMEAVKVLMGKAPDAAAVALHEVNQKRKDLDKQITEEALELIKAEEIEQPRMSTVLKAENWHKGVVGIVASRLIETYYRPTIVLTHSNGELVGSGRSIPGFDLHEALHTCKEHLLQFGGHTHAAGLKLQPEKYPAFKQAFEHEVRKALGDVRQEAPLSIDSELSLTQINESFMDDLDKMRPFGPANRTPVFCAKEVQVLEATVLKGVHLRLRVAQNYGAFEAIAFYMAEKWHQLGQPTFLHLAFQPYWDFWKDHARIKLRIKDFKSTNEILP
ncbi:MAG: single-stranded-DNA-specific exonuclease RecJ [Bacteroidota bacterium]